MWDKLQLPSGKVLLIRSGCQAITVKYLGFTNTKPSRFMATAPAGKKMVVSTYHDTMSEDQVKDKLAEDYARSYRWLNENTILVRGTTANGETVYVLTEVREQNEQDYNV